MKKRYVQFVDQGFHRGSIYYAGNPSQELIEELGLQLTERTGPNYYFTTLQNMADLGWTLQFVTPCGLTMGGSSHMFKGGPIENSYIFFKE